MQLQTGEVELGGYRYFTIYDPKKRQICAAPFAQRVLHHALMNVCHPFFEQKQVADSYASIASEGFKPLAGNTGRGVPIGNLTSQYFANHYLCPADHFVKEALHVPGYVRYMDDMVLWHDDKEALLNAGLLFQEYVEENLKLKLKPFCLNKNTAGLPFLGYLLYPETTRLAQRSRRRYIQKSTMYEQLLEAGLWSQKEFQRHITPLTAFTQYAQARAFRQRVHEMYLKQKQVAT